MILFYHTLTGNDSGKRKKVLLTAAPASAPCSRRRRRSPPQQIPLRRKKTSTRMCSSSHPGRHSYTWDPRAKQQPTGLIACGAAHRRPVQIPLLRTAVTLVDIPTGWDPHTNQKPTGLLIAPPAAWPVLFQIPLLRPKQKSRHTNVCLLFLVGAAGFEPTASSSRTRRATNCAMPRKYRSQLRLRFSGWG